MTKSDEILELITFINDGVANLDAFYAYLPYPLYHRAFEAYNGSLDSAFMLHNAVIQGWAFKIWGIENDDADVVVYPPIIAPYIGYERVEGVDIFSAEVDGYNPARAWLIAILKAYYMILNNPNKV